MESNQTRFTDEAIKAATIVTIDYAKPEVTIDRLSSIGDLLVKDCFDATSELSDVETDLAAAEGRVAVAARAVGTKPTESAVAAIVDSDPEVIGLRKRAGKLRAKVSAMRTDIENLHDKRRMFCSWLDSQSRAGVR